MSRKFVLLAALAAALTALLSSTASAFTFAPAQIRVAGLAQQEMHGVEAADIDGDGLLDAVASGYYSGAPGGDPVIAVLRGRANGTLAPVVNYPMTGAGPVTGLALGDFNEDGSPDAALGSPFSEELVISLNDGDGGFEAPTPLPSGGFSPDDPLVADFDADGHLDLASANGSSYSVYLGNGDGSFEPALNEEIEDWALTIAAGDFDDDGIVDLALGNVDAGTVRILLGEGDGTFVAAPPVDLEALAPEEECFCVEIWGIAAGDLDGNGRDDLVVSDRFENRLFSVLSNPDGTFTGAPPVDLEELAPEEECFCVEIWGIAAGDIDGNGTVDADDLTVFANNFGRRSGATQVDGDID
ncbi:MAG TPA: VCBS repeat-containing protein, partial [Solirubrobacterales bacterium]|nr:VCBS repeat-containing protein [Solirubrobacterales bacterium]